MISTFGLFEVSQVSAITPLDVVYCEKYVRVQQGQNIGSASHWICSLLANLKQLKHAEDWERFVTFLIKTLRLENQFLVFVTPIGFHHLFIKTCAAGPLFRFEFEKYICTATVQKQMNHSDDLEHAV